MPNDYLNQVKLNGTTYDIKDTVSGYTTNTGTVTGVTAGTGLSGGTISTSGTISLDTTRAISTSDIDTGTDTTNKLVSAKTISDAIDNAISGIPTVDEKVKQTSINTNGSYPILLKKSANATEETNTVNATNLTSGTAISINPSTGDLNVVKINGQTVGSSPKFTDTNTTYTLSGALSSHKFTSTLTAGGSGSGTSTSDITLAAGNNITLTDDTSNRKITISATVPTVPVTDVQVNSTSILSNGVANLKTSTSHPYSSTNALATMGDIAAAGGGTVTSVRVQATSPVQSSQNTAQDSTLDTTISLADGYGDTKNPYTSKTKNTVLAAPSTANGVPTFRALTDADIPSGYLKDSHTGSNFTAGISYLDDLDGSGPAFFTNGTSGGSSVFATAPGIVSLIAHDENNTTEGQIVINSDGVNISGSSVNISNVSTPTQNSDAANKKYVDDKVADLDSSITATTGQAISAITITDGKISGSNKISVGDANQNAFSNVKVGSTTIAADTTTDTLELVAGTDITLTPDTTNDKVTIAFNNASGYTTNTGTVTSIAAGTGLKTDKANSAAITDSGTLSLDTTYALSSSDISTGTDTTAKLVSAKTIADAIGGFGGGTVTSVSLTNADGESDFTITGSPVTSAGTIKIDHANSTTAKSTQGVYPITFDKHGHITGSGNAVTISDTITGWYGTSSTTASTAEKSVTCTGYVLNKGNIIGVLFSTANTAATPTLNVNSTGAKSIYVGASTPSSTTNVLKWSANTMVYFMYDGTYYRYLYATASASVTPPRGANVWYGTGSVAAGTQAKTATIDNYVLTKGSLIAINSSTANTYTSAKITLNINSTGAKDVYKNNAVTSSTNTLLWDANTTLLFVYDGTGYTYLGSSRDTQNLGTVTSVTASGILSSSGGTTPAITHNAPTTSPATSGDAAVYPIKIDSYGHIIEKGSAVTIPSVTSTYSSTGTTAVNGTAVNAALQTLDSSITATTGQAISAITITDGKIASSSKISVGEANLVTDVQINGTSILSSKVANFITNTAYNSSTNKLATMSDVGVIIRTWS